ncbi:Copia protein [Linum perenne]
MSINFIDNNINSGDMCIIDSASTHTILKDKKYFTYLVMREANVSTISGSANLIEGSGRANVLLHRGTKMHIEDALYSTQSCRNLLSYKDIRRNGYHIETMEKENKEYLAITSIISGKNNIHERLPAISSGLYYTYISTIESHATINSKFMNHEKFVVWHNRLGHPGSIMMRKILENLRGHSVMSNQIPQSKDLVCTSCSQGKLIIRPSPTKVRHESPTFLERIQGDICGPIHLPCGPFRYFMVLIDASTKWSHVSLLSTRNMAFARLLAQLIRLRAHFLDYPTKKICLDNAREFTSQTFNDFCMSIGIDVEHLVAHVHTQNGLAESLIKRLQLIERPLLMKTNHSTSCWGQCYFICSITNSH